MGFEYRLYIMWPSLLALGYALLALRCKDPAREAWLRGRVRLILLLQLVWALVGNMLLAALFPPQMT